MRGEKMSEAKEKFYDFVGYLENVNIHGNTIVSDYIKELEKQNEALLSVIIAEILYSRVDVELDKHPMVEIVEQIKQKPIEEILKEMEG
jgi:hypothetical protein